MESNEVGARFVAAEVGGDAELAELVHALEAASSEIPVPPDRLERAKSRVLAAASAVSSVGLPRWARRVAGAAAAAVLALGIGGTAAAAGDAQPGSPLWSLRAAGWNLRLAFSAEDRQAELLVEQASEAAEMAEAAARACDTKGAEVAREEALSRLDRARRHLEGGEGDAAGFAADIARVEEKLAALQSRDFAVCDGEGSERSGPSPAVVESGTEPTPSDHRSSEPSAGPSPSGETESKKAPSKESGSGPGSTEPGNSGAGPAGSSNDGTPKGGRPEGKGNQPSPRGYEQRPAGGGAGRP